MQHIRQKVVLNLSLARRWCLWCNQWVPKNAVTGTWELCAKFALVTKEKHAIVPSTVAAFPWMFTESYCTWLGKSKHQSTCNYGHVINSTVSTKKKKTYWVEQAHLRYFQKHISMFLITGHWDIVNVILSGVT